MSEKISHTIRFPKDLHDALEERTTTNDLSFNETVVRMLQWGLVASGGQLTTTTTTVTRL